MLFCFSQKLAKVVMGKSWKSHEIFFYEVCRNPDSGDYALGAFAPPGLAYIYSWSKSECTKTNSTARTVAEILPKTL